MGIPHSALLCSLTFLVGPGLAQQIQPLDLIAGYSGQSFGNSKLNALRDTAVGWISLGQTSDGKALMQVRSDGTPQGTSLAYFGIHLNSKPSEAEELPGGLAVMTRPFLGAAERELLLGDGSPAGTSPVTGLVLPPWEGVELLAKVNDRAWFFAQQGTGFGVWTATASATSVSPLPNLWPQLPQGVGRASLAGLDSKALIWTELDSAPALWVSDGTPGGTQFLRNFPFTGASATGSPLRTVVTQRIGSLLYFAFSQAGDDSGIWRTDGSVAGTYRVDFGTSPNLQHRLCTDGTRLYAMSSATSPLSNTPTRITIADSLGLISRVDLPLALVHGRLGPVAGINGRLIFAGQSPTTGLEAWASDGTLAGTLQLADLTPGSGDGLRYTSSSHPILPMGTRVAFAGYAGPDRLEVFTTNGSPAGTQMLTPFVNTADGLAARGFSVAGGRAVVAPSIDQDEGVTFWAYGQGSAQKLLDADYNYALAGARPLRYLRLLDQIYFVGRNPQEFGPYDELWRSDGTLLGSKIITALSKQPSGLDSGAPASPQPWDVLGKRLLFFAADPKGPPPLYKLWSWTAGESAPQVLLSSASFNINRGARLGDRYVFSAPAIGGLQPIYVTDGTPAGTAQVLTLPLFTSVNNSVHAVLGNNLLFTSFSFLQGTQLWITDGTAAGTQPPLSILPSVLSSPKQMLTFGNKAYLLFLDGSTQTQSLYVTDGTAAGTQPFGDLVPGVPDDVDRLTLVGDRLAFAVRDVTGEFEPWISDGTLAGTTRLVDLPALNQERLSLGSAGPRLWFARSLYNPQFPDGLVDVEIWTSQGTPASTQPLSLLSKYGKKNQELPAFMDLGFQDRILFNGKDDAGVELWVSDGTTPGTRRLLDLAAGPSSGLEGPLMPYMAARLGSAVLVSAIIDGVGAELVSIPNSVIGGWSQTTLGETCLGAAGRPALWASGNGSLGGNLSIAASQLPPQAPSALLVSTSPALPLGAGVCSLQLVNPIGLALSSANSNGVATFPMAVPVQPSLLDRALYFQALSVDPVAGFNGFFGLTGLLEVVISQ